ncbi:DUF4173 domain-containing protein [Streptomyces sp. ITFR-16]|uniref:DUF4153 domain-containing protein n=1 Tax=Streptomyces sp. ITFR-16 TaxID=3075198 RepID=UPI00288B265C|nr:DUF4173 domain-containing protein [Streptomyces sp. ITFR-16]WNI22039.1 DUF4173 domain-containing protein [Streptomyces sp. ITFR-16]
MSDQSSESPRAEHAPEPSAAAAPAQPPAPTQATGPGGSGAPATAPAQPGVPAQAQAAPGAQPQGAVPEPPKIPAYAQQGRPPQQPNPWAQSKQDPSTISRLRPVKPGTVHSATLWSILATTLLSALLLGDGIGPNLLIVAVPASLGAYYAARAAGRRLRPWTAVWGIGGLALLAVPALRDAGWPTFLAIVSAVALGSLALHGSRSWLGVFLGSLGLLTSVAESLGWGVRGVRDRMSGSRGRWGVVFRSVAVAVLLLIVFGALFASADAAFADVLGNLMPDVSVGEGPWRLFLALIGLVGSLAAAYTAAAPVHWDGLSVRPGRARGRLEWALPLVVLNLLFAGFLAIQLTVLLGGYDKVMAETDLSYSEYARQGFWQLLWATVLTLGVIALALRWAPRGGARDRTLVRGVLGTLCLLTLIVVASALRRMDLYVDAYGLTRLRISVAAVELWLGVVLVLIMAAGVFGPRLLPRAVAASAAVGVLAFGLISPDGLIAEQNVQRYRSDHSIDIEYLSGLSADAVPALDTLPEPLRSCALEKIQRTLRDSDEPWYATSWGETRARDILGDWDPGFRTLDCRGMNSGDNGSERDGGTDDSYDPYDPY